MKLPLRGRKPKDQKMHRFDGGRDSESQASVLGEVVWKGCQWPSCQGGLTSPRRLAPLCTSACAPGLGATRGPGAVFGCLTIKGLRAWLLTSLWPPPPTTGLEVTGGEASPAVDQPRTLHSCLEPAFQLWWPPYPPPQRLRGTLSKL